MTRPPDVKEIEKDIEVIRGEKEAAIKAQDFEKAASLRDKEKQTKERLDTILAEWREEREEKQVVVTADDMMSIVSKVTGVPLQRMEQKETEKLLQMETELKGKVVGQDEAVVAISKALRRSRADLKDPRRPIGSFIFLGPTGVGKTFLAQILEDGKITDSLGRKIDFRNTIITMTSNVGAEILRRQTTMGFAATKPLGEHEFEAMRDRLLEEAKKVFKPEFINRLDDLIVFH